MNIFSSVIKNAAAVAARPADVQGAPLNVTSGGDAPHHKIKVDGAYRFNKFLVVAGWCTASAEIGLWVNGRALDVRRIRIPREDVAAHLELAEGGQLGFVVVAEAPTDAAVCLGWDLALDGHVATSQPLKFNAMPPSAPGDLAVLGPAVGMLALACEPHTKQWTSLIRSAPGATVACRTARGYLEGGSACETTRDAVIVGWVVQAPGTIVWLEDEAGRTFSLHGAYRRFRQDVHDAVGSEFGHASRDAGFVVRVRGVKPGGRVRLMTLSESGVHVLSETVCSTLPLDPVGAARWLFAVGTPLQDLHRRFPLVDEPVLGKLIEHRQMVWDELPVLRRDLGEVPVAPKVSVIVPLYGRTDFVEHQLLEFSADEWFRAHAELVYVIDDPKLIETFPAQAESLHRLYRLPFRWIWGSVNRGYSGANNLGARNSRGNTLVFLNSDAFPQGPGWLQPLLQVLAERPDVGAVGPRLVFADGSIQHAGMQFERREELGVWVNHHPMMGLAPELDRGTTLRIMPSVTGACMVMRRADLERVGGWDTGYLIGDFEDSDICLKLRSAGYQVAYLPTVQLTHLERQSFKLLGQDEFRTRVVIYNAVRHQTRWAQMIAEPVAAEDIAARAL